MKTWVKQGLGLLVGLAFSVVAAAASEPIKDRDAFEKQYIACIKSGLKNDCFLSLSLKHMVPRTPREDEEKLKKLNNMLKERFAERFANLGIYDVHVSDKVMTAGISEYRTYFLERKGDGAMAACGVVFHKILGEWYIFTFLWSDSEEKVRKLLKLDLEL
jgi:hypothetical protein